MKKKREKNLPIYPINQAKESIEVQQGLVQNFQLSEFPMNQYTQSILVQ